jgi:hypothetical protein
MGDASELLSHIGLSTSEHAWSEETRKKAQGRRWACPVRIADLLMAAGMQNDYFCA